MLSAAEECTLTLDEYTTTAEKAIKKWGHPKMLNDEGIGAVIHMMMKADLKFDGRGTRSGYRMKAARYAIGRLFSLYHLSKERAKKKPKILSLNHIIDSTNGEETEMYTMVDSGYEPPDVILENQERNSKVYNTIMESDVLTPREKQVLRGYYWDNKKIPALAREFNVSNQAVQQHLSHGIEKLKNIL